MKAKAISLWQPWASLMALGLKKIETRPWSTKYRGPILIHAAKKRVADPNGYVFDAIRNAGLEISSLPRGCLLCRVRLIDCRRIEIDDRIEIPEQFFGDYTPGRYMWITDHLQGFEPIPWTGRQRIFNVDLEGKEIPWN